LIDRAIEEKPAFIDIFSEQKRTKRGIEETIPEKWEVNNDEKSNLCGWICENGSTEDFANFAPVLQWIEAQLAAPSQR
jgi:hypothetical protein